jgi:phospholipid/cholesterol/gamma-HCH transport system substrate-binding protein
MTRGRRRVSTHRRLIGYGLVVAAAVAGALALGYTSQSGLPWKRSHSVSVTLPTAANMGRHDPVRIGGRRVGQIVSVSVSPASARLTVELEDSVWPLPAGTSALPRARSALGQSYLELRPGRGAGAIPDGGSVGPASDADPVSLQEVLSIFDPHVRARAQELLAQLGTGVAARGPQIAATLSAAPATLADVAGVATAVNRRGEPLGRFVDGAGAAVAAAHPAAAELARGFRPEAEVLGAVPAEAVAVRTALRVAPDAMRHVAHDLEPATRLLTELDGLARDSRPLLKLASLSLRKTAALLPVAGAGLASLDRPLRRLAGATGPTMTLLRTFSPVATPAIRTLANGATTFLDLSGRTCDLRRWLTTWGGRDGILGFRNATAGFLRFVFVNDEAPLTGGGEGSSGTRMSVYRPGTRCSRGG